MNEKNELIHKYGCKLCNKYYASHSSLCNHNRKFHTTFKQPKHDQKHPVNDNKQPINDKQLVNDQKQLVNDHKFICLYCNKNFNHYNNKWRHEKTCKNNNSIKIDKNIELEKIKLEQIKIKLELENIKLTNINNNLTNTNFKSLNKLLMNKSYEIKNSNINSNNTQNIINNYNLVTIGNENLVDTLTYKEKKQIMNSRLCSLEKLVEIAHCGNYNKFKNIVITNLKDNLAYKYDDKKGYFITVTKNELLNDFITNRIFDIEAIYDELSEANKIDDNIKKLIQKFLDQIQSNEPYINEEEDIKYNNYKSYKINKIKILLYNNLDKISKDIALLFSN